MAMRSRVYIGVGMTHHRMLVNLLADVEVGHVQDLRDDGVHANQEIGHLEFVLSHSPTASALCLKLFHRGEGKLAAAAALLRQVMAGEGLMRCLVNEGNGGERMLTLAT
eukprot:6213448-Pleurochrysis_carterae.AAC.4